MNIPARAPLALLLSAALIPQAHAVDRYVTVAGAGTKDGTSWANAMAATSLVATLNTTMAPGDTLYLGGPEAAGGANYGDLRFALTSSGTSAAKKRLIGVDRGFGIPTFVGAQPTRSYTTITFNDQVSHWTVGNLRIERREYGISTAGTGHIGLELDSVTVRDVSQRCFSFTDCDDLLVKNCHAERYNRKGFMFVNACDRVTLRDCTANGTGTTNVGDDYWPTVMSDPVGFDFHVKDSPAAANTDILLEGCVSFNNDENTGDSYEQGDGFKMERSNDGVTLKRCLAYRNQDAGFDLKGSGQIVDDSLSIHNSRYGFKLWYSGLMTNCIAVSNGARQFTLPATNTGNVITARLCTFHCASNTQAGVVIETSGNTAVLENCVISYAANAGTYTGGPGTFSIPGTVKHTNASNTANAPEYVNPVLPWDGQGDDFDNQTYGMEKGYNSTLVTTGASAAVNLANAADHTLAPTDVVGAVPSANWNNSTANNQTLTDILDHTGAPTTIDVAFVNTAFGYLNSTPAFAAPLDDDAKMMRSTRALSNGSTMAFVASQVPYATYDVYVYWGGQTNGETVPATMTVELQADVAGTWTTQETRYMKDSNRAWDGTYEESTATSTAAAVDGQEYVVFRNLTSSTFRIRSTCGVRAAISGFQIVEH